MSVSVARALPRRLLPWVPHRGGPYTCERCGWSTRIERNHDPRCPHCSSHLVEVRRDLWRARPSLVAHLLDMRHRWERLCRFPRGARGAAAGEAVGLILLAGLLGSLVLWAAGVVSPLRASSFRAELLLIGQAADSVELRAVWTPVAASDGQGVTTYELDVRSADTRAAVADLGSPATGRQAVFQGNVVGRELRFRVPRPATFLDTTWVGFRVRGVRGALRGPWPAPPHPTIGITAALTIPPVDTLFFDSTAVAFVWILPEWADRDSLRATDPDLVELWRYVDVGQAESDELDRAWFPHLHSTALGTPFDCFRQIWRAPPDPSSRISADATVSNCRSRYVQGHLFGP